MRVQAPKYKWGRLPVSERPAVLSRNCPTQKREIHDKSFSIRISNASTPFTLPSTRENGSSATKVRPVPKDLNCRIQTFSITKLDFPKSFNTAINIISHLHIPTGRNGQLSRNWTPIPHLQFYLIPLLLSALSSKPLEVELREQLASNHSIFLTCNPRHQLSPVLHPYYPL
ncbi:hypothetical protein CEXT_693991 [Caerostris extrusa]|uniref:Uncharacterized protein n=1 Tax=Caerostris extrusa TaxID=172846 RepID=A0AAV4PIL9_CAEEX|nr:hypothetical protein CEXT_693991 [Caerostris extrusa]